jgi:hypothetical protein
LQRRQDGAPLEVGVLVEAELVVLENLGGELVALAEDGCPDLLDAMIRQTLNG